MSLKIENISLLFTTCLISIMASYPLISFSFGIPSVDLCMEKTGLTEEQCQEKMKNFGDMSLQEKIEMKNELMGNAAKDISSSTDLKNSAAKIIDNSVVIESKIKEVQRIKIDKEEKFAQILEKALKIKDFLQSNNVDVSGIEKDISMFNEKSSNVIGAYDKYIRLLKESQNTGISTSKMEQQERRMIGRLTGELVVFSRIILQENLRLQIRSISNN
ncbi:MAG: hypothetical protein ACWGHO_05595 [Candidatus Moraniibacteriota bacterium]